MATQLTFDQLNTLSEEESLKSKVKRSVPYREWFGDMLLEPEEKEKRIAMAEALDDVFLFLFALILAHGGADELLTYSYLYETTEKRYWDAISAFIVAEDSTGQFDRPVLSRRALEQLERDIKEYIARQTRYIVDATIDHIDDVYYTSEDRAEFVSENQINGVENMVEDAEAIDSGMSTKTWVAMIDSRTRESHAEADGQTVPINEPFHIGDSELMFPGDDSLGADASELVNCRCTVEYGDDLDLLEEREKAKAHSEYEVQKYGETWREESLSETIARFNATMSLKSADGRKTTYTSADKRYEISYDNYGNYFRVLDTSKRGKGKYVDVNGNDMLNVVENGKQRGRTQAEFNRDTHFKDKDIR